jgi:AcrR family transcriptional regulator
MARIAKRASTAGSKPKPRRPAANKAAPRHSTSPPLPTPPQLPAAPRAARQARRRDAILAAALEEFSARGFAATRLDDVAARAGVAKGTIYLYFSDKEKLFQELARSMLTPILGALETVPMSDLPARELAGKIADLFVREVFGTRRKDVIRLIISEGPRFPKIAEFYYREVVQRAMTAVGALMQRAVERGELRNDALARFPQLLIAPGLVAIVWSGLFDRFAPLDAGALMHAHIDLLFGARSPP